jgi:site-specific DNA recombinase
LKRLRRENAELRRANEILKSASLDFFAAITRLTDSQQPPTNDDHTAQQAGIRLAACDKKLASYRAALDAGADPAVVTAWITETQKERQRIEGSLAATPQPESRPRLTRDQIRAIVQQVGELTTVLAEADPTDRAEIYRQLGFKLTYHPEQQKSAYRLSLTRTHMGK